MARVLRILLAGLLSACGGAGRSAVWAEHGAAAWSWDLRIEEGLERAELSTCFAAPPRGWLAPAEPEGLRLLVDAAVVDRAGRRRPAQVTARGVALDGLAAGECVVTRVELEAVARGWEGLLASAGAGVASPLLVLWAPRPRRDDARIELSLRLPAGITASVPWERRGPGRYRLDASAIRWRGFLAFGRFTIEPIAVAGGTLEVARLGDEPMRASPAAIRRWLTRAALAASSILGELPAPRVQVLLVPRAGGGRSPVYFGATSRGGGAGVVLFVNADAGDEDLSSDWVAPHELSHFALPVVPDADAWLSEGFVTYYAEVGRARVGLRTAEQAWEALARGCARGQAQDGARTLAEESEDMHETHAYQRVYWGGAALALRADVEIRRASAGRASLDTALRAIARSRRRPGRVLPAEELLRRVPDEAGGRVLARVVEEVRGRHGTLPSIDETLSRLGVHRRPDGTVALEDDAPDAHLRRAITAPLPAGERD